MRHSMKAYETLKDERLSWDFQRFCLKIKDLAGIEIVLHR